MPLLVLITTSGTGSRLESKTKYTNKSLVKVGDKYAICYIFDLYPKDTEFIITTGYYGQQVKDFCKMAYPELSIQFVDIDKYEGEGSSLGYSMLQAKEYIQRPFIFHCCDTILKEYPFPSVLSGNMLLVSSCKDIRSYMGIKLKTNKFNVKCFTKKGELCDYSYKGVVYIQEYDMFWDCLQSIYSMNMYDQTLNDVYAMQSMLANNCKITYTIVDNVFDTGNIYSYKETCENFKSAHDVLEKHDESLCFLDTKVIKFFANKDMNLKRVYRANILHPFTPTIFSHSDNFMCMEYVQGKLLSECTGYGEIYNLMEWAHTNLWSHTIQNPKYRDVCNRFYKVKTETRLKGLSFLEKECNTINTIETGSIQDLLSKTPFEYLSTDIFGKFHGDFILDNIMKVGLKYVVLDWRQEFDTELDVGDVYYDLAKLKHNIIFNHKNITNDLYSVDYIQNQVNVDLKCNYVLMYQLEDYTKFTEKYKYSINKINILVGIIWLNMAPLYQGKLSEFLFYFGKLHLYLAIQALP